MTLPGPRAASQRRNIPQPGPSIPTPRRPLPYRSPRPPRALACSLPQVFPGEKENTKSSNLRLKTCRAPASAPESSRALEPHKPARTAFPDEPAADLPHTLGSAGQLESPGGGLGRSGPLS
ncbi:translation initiation factor IF-2-like isoform X2 [Phyllostomus discolor]|uniref:Translation initiation factor IF-2-like isoform X2 n=1 Tax=Phyllostomus discolor TaxID=89673 RepID=A0A7E6CEF2_9CHIR|nr:translation initiation factor IF-2-like isoform X2 [Phyllostomus discolor]